MIARSDLAAIARSRLREARLLYKNSHYDGAAYLCGYAVELALKVRLCRHLRWGGFPETRSESNWAQALKIHDLDALLDLTGVHTRIISTCASELPRLCWEHSYEHRDGRVLRQDQEHRERD